MQWYELPVNMQQLRRVPGMLSNEECQLILWHTLLRYSGKGEIVECGSFLGLSTSIMAIGLRANTRVEDKHARITTYDQYLHFHPSFDHWLSAHGVARGESFEHVFHAYLQPLAEHIQVQSGDILQKSWLGKPIELLLVDMAFNWELHNHITSTFYQHLMAGESVIYHQDYLYSYYYWQHLLMEFIADYVQMEHIADTSVTFSVQSAIPQNMLTHDLRTLSIEQQFALMDASIARFSGENKGLAELNKVSMLLDIYGQRAAYQHLIPLIKNYAQHPNFMMRARTLLKSLTPVTA